MSQWEVVIGLETHTQLRTRSKMFSGSSTAFGAQPNRQASPVDLALPGVLPVANREAVACAIRFGLAVGAQIAPRSVFARKNYFYPDLPKGYQISQFEIPVVAGGQLTFIVGEGDSARACTVNLTRAHLEEDAGKSLHEDFNGRSGIDLNRAGTPLLEIVTEPEMRSADEAVAYARALHGLVVWLGICDGNMQEGSFRCDANVSVRRPGGPLGTRCEIKNLNSFRFLERAIQYEVRRQIALIEDGGKVVQQTRLYDPDRDETRSMRSKEDANDYRYFPDPDLPDLVIEPQWIVRERATMPELPAAMRARFTGQLGLTDYDAATLTATRECAAYFEQTLAALGAQQVPAKTVANWVMSEVAAAVNRDDVGYATVPVPPTLLAALLVRTADGTVSARVARDLFGGFWLQAPTTPADLAQALALVDAQIEKQGLRQMNDEGELTAIVERVVAANPKPVAEFLAGKDKALNSLVGQVMKATAGKANPQRINELLREVAARQR
ncbi:MAG: Asp-tRNA(Asn)/Glu-tRNA(Gln) amidotransferase subunit GatB [Burkholderiaceae bacterium]